MTAHNDYVDTVKPVVETLSDIHQRGHSRNQVFTDWLDLMLAGLERDDEAYQKACQPYDEAAITEFATAFSELQVAMSEENHELLGVIYEHLGQGIDALGQHFTPHNVCTAKAKMAGIVEDDATDDEPTSIADPACGSGRLLVAAAKAVPEDRDAVFHGTDKDPTCAKMTALNFTFFNMDGVVIHGDALTSDAYKGWKTRSTSLGGEVTKLSTDELQKYHFSTDTATPDTEDTQREIVKTLQPDLSEF